MPVYEFYCGDCHMIFNFFARRVDTTTRPKCPRCGKPKLQRQVSSFATIGKSGSSASGEDDSPGDMDESKLEGLMESMSRQAEGLDENNPRQMAAMMRQMHEATGMPLNGRAEEAIRRMEAGESPEKLEEELGDLFGEEGPDADSRAGRRRKKSRSAAPAVDATLYDM
jgi:putative FmdB family regulatory protein